MTNQPKSKEFKQPVCPNCNSKWVRYRLRDNTYVCLRCGGQWPKKDKAES